MGNLRSLRVLVTAVGGGVGQAILKALRFSDLKLFIVGADPSPLSAGFALCDKAYLVPYAKDSDYKTRIFRICSQEAIDYLFPGSDFELLPLSEIKEELWSKLRCRIIVADEACVRLCRDKLKTYAFFRRKGLPFAETVPFTAFERFVKERGFPIIAKPVGGSSSSGTRILFSREEAHTVRNPEQYILQEYLVPIQWGKTHVRPEDVFVSGELRQEHEISVQVLRGSAGETLGVFVSENVLKKGIPMRIEPRTMPEVERVAMSMADALHEVGLSGPLNIQGKITQRGFVAFEVNPRFTGITGVRTILGFRECEAMIRYFEGENPQDFQHILCVDPQKVVLRFVDDVVMDRAFLEALAQEGGTP